MNPLGANEEDYTDGRELWQWRSRYPVRAQKEMKCEAIALGILLAVTLLFAGVCLGFGPQLLEVEIHGLVLSVSFQLLAAFLTGCVGGVTFSMKWLIHSVAKGKWHQDRRYWRFLVPMVGGVYACVVITLWDVGLVSSRTPEQANSSLTVGALAFLIGYFSDGVSGLLSNVANSVFGTVQKK